MTYLFHALERLTQAATRFAAPPTPCPYSLDLNPRSGVDRRLDDEKAEALERGMPVESRAQENS